MRTRLFLLLVMVVVVSSLATAAAAPAQPTQTQQQFLLTFSNADQVYVFTGTTTPGTTLRVDTMDCCIPGDQWGVRIFARAGGDDDDDDDDDGGDDDGAVGSDDDDGDDDNGGGRLQQVAEACGTGSATAFTGEASARVSGPFVVEVFQCNEPNISPSSMFVRFRYENGFGAAAQTATCQDPDKSCEPPGGYLAPGTGGGDDDDDEDDD